MGVIYRKTILHSLPTSQPNGAGTLALTFIFLNIAFISMILLPTSALAQTRLAGMNCSLEPGTRAGGFQKPVRPVNRGEWTITNDFGNVVTSEDVPGLPPGFWQHTGVDYLLGGLSRASQQQTIYAAGAGVVVFSTRSNPNPKPRRGGLVIIRHLAPEGEQYPIPKYEKSFTAGSETFTISYPAFETQEIITYYLHLDPDQVFVSQGDQVSAGQPIAKLYSLRDVPWKFAFVPHLHFEVWKKCSDIERNGYDRAGAEFQRAVANLLIDPVSFLLPPAPPLRMYDDFSAPQIDALRWDTLEQVREIRGGKLISEIRVPQPVQENGLFLANPATARAIEADVDLTEVEPPPSGASNTNGARVLLAMYNDGTPGGGFAGDVITDLHIGIQPGASTPDAFFQVFKCNDASCTSSSQFIFTSFGPVSVGVPHQVGISWDGSVARVRLDSTAHIFDPRGFAPVLGPPISGYSGLTTVAASRVAAEFDNVMVNGGFYDDFSGPNIDPSRWRTFEFVREIQDGKLALRTRGIRFAGGIHNSLRFRDPEGITAVQAEVQVDFFTATDALVQAYLSGFFLNDGRATGIPGDHTGDVFALLGLFSAGTTLEARFQVGVCDGPDCNTSFRSLTEKSLGKVTVGSTNKLLISWDGTNLTFRLNNRSPTTFSPPSAGGHPNSPEQNIATTLTCFAIGCEADIQAKIDNVFISAD